MNWENFFRTWIKQERDACVEEVTRLISEDAPKNKFSIISGRMRALEDLASEMDKFVSKTRDPRG